MKCSHTDCGYPKGECASDCLLYLQMHRVDTSLMTKQCAAIKGKVEELPIAEPEPRLTAAWTAYKTNRAKSRSAAIAKAWRAFWRKA